MNEVFEITREFLFKTNIHEITSISIEHNYDIDGSNVEGEFIVSGDYRLHEISINKEKFSFKIPFSHELKDNINLDTVEVDITDFTYDFKNDDELSVHIEYTVSAEQGIIEFADEKDLDEFLENNEAEVIDLSSNEEETREETSEEVPENNEENNKKEEERKEEIANLLDEYIENTNEIEIPKVSTDDKLDHNMILNSINSEDEFVKYHIHTVIMNDTLESICKKYDVSINTLKKYNSFDNLELNMKLLIPENEEN